VYCSRCCLSVCVFLCVFATTMIQSSLALWSPLLLYGYSYMPNRVKPSFVIFDIRALWRSAWASECPDVKNYNLARFGIGCFIAATVSVKGLNDALYWPSQANDILANETLGREYRSANLVYCAVMAMCNADMAMCLFTADRRWVVTSYSTTLQVCT